MYMVIPGNIQKFVICELPVCIFFHKLQIFFFQLIYHVFALVTCLPFVLHVQLTTISTNLTDFVLPDDTCGLLICSKHSCCETKTSYILVAIISFINL